MEKLDGNAAAGILSEVFALEVSGARGRCASCGNVSALGDAHSSVDVSWGVALVLLAPTAATWTGHDEKLPPWFKKHIEKRIMLGLDLQGEPSQRTAIAATGRDQALTVSGEDADAKAYATATLPTLQAHLKKIRAIAAAAGVS